MIDYADEGGCGTQRTIWPFLVGYRDAVRVAIALCELRRDFRMFRLDRISTIEFLVERYRDRPTALRRRWLVMMAAADAARAATVADQTS